MKLSEGVILQVEDHAKKYKVSGGEISSLLPEYWDKHVVQITIPQHFKGVFNGDCYIVHDGLLFKAI